MIYLSRSDEQWQTLLTVFRITTTNHKPGSWITKHFFHDNSKNIENEQGKKRKQLRAKKVDVRLNHRRISHVYFWHIHFRQSSLGRIHRTLSKNYTYLVVTKNTTSRPCRVYYPSKQRCVKSRYLDKNKGKQSSSRLGNDLFPLTDINSDRVCYKSKVKLLSS